MYVYTESAKLQNIKKLNKNKRTKVSTVSYKAKPMVSKFTPLNKKVAFLLPTP